MKATTYPHSLVMESAVGLLQLTSDGIALTGVHFLDDELSPDHSEGKAVPVLVETRRQLDRYLSGRLHEFRLPLAAVGTPFQQRVWAELRRIPYGATASYGEVAIRLGMSRGASRAVGLANGSNPIAIVVPCHRVIGSSGTLTGYAGGLARKRFLLGLEATSVEGSLFADVSG
jgi:methylated-DNA-[protein]-cysteine S-methyltransferase